MESKLWEFKLWSKLALPVLVLLAAALGAVVARSDANATHFSTPTPLWGYEAAAGSARILQYDLMTDTSGPNCTTDSTANGRGIAFDPIDGNLWYTRVDSFTFAGDGLIHKATLPLTAGSCSTLASIPFGDGPGGTVQDDVGALDIDPDDGNIWAAGYANTGGLFTNTPNALYKVNRVTGAIIQSCTIPPADDNGNDTLAVAKLSGLSGSGKYLLTDDGEFLTNTLYAFDVAACVGGGLISPVTSFTTVDAGGAPYGITGLDFEQNTLIATDLSTIVSFGSPPFGPTLTVGATMSAAPSGGLEDITLQTGTIPASALTLSPKTKINPVGTQHCVTATATASGNPTPNITVVFSVTGSVTASGSDTTDANGEATFCYNGPALPGSDAISAFADNNNDGVQQANEPFDTAAKTWVLPSGTGLCVVKITNGGWIVTDDADRGTFGGVAKESGSLVASGHEEYQDHGPAEPMNVNSLSEQAITCNTSRTQATIFGTATIDGAGVHNFRIDVQDNGEPGKFIDHYRIRLDTGYDSGDHILRGGNVQIHS